LLIFIKLAQKSLALPLKSSPLMGEGFGCESFGSEPFGCELKAERFRVELLGRTVWVGVITLPLIPSHQGRGNRLLDRL